MIMNASLTLKYKKQAMHIILLPGDKISFGRDQTNDVRLALFPLEEYVLQSATADISRKHFEIYRENNRYWIQDVGSTNGTSLNCIALLTKAKPLSPSHIIDVGGVLEMKIIMKNDTLWLHRINNVPQESYLLFSKEITIGNTEENTLCFTEESTQEYQAKIFYKGDNTYWIELKKGKILIEQNPLNVDDPCCLEKETQLLLGENILMLFNLLKPFKENPNEQVVL